MSTSRTLAVVTNLLLGAALLAASEGNPGLTPAAADDMLMNTPLTLVFSKVVEGGVSDGTPFIWSWSINSAGQAELTVNFTADLATLTPSKTTRQAVKLSAERMDAIRRALRDARFFHLKAEYGPVYIHGGWSTLTVVAGHGQQPSKSVRYYSSWAWPSDWKGEKAALVKAAPAVRVWLSVCEAVDPDGKVFPERQKVAEAVRALKP